MKHYKRYPVCILKAIVKYAWLASSGESEYPYRVYAVVIKAHVVGCLVDNFTKKVHTKQMLEWKITGHISRKDGRSGFKSV